MDMPIQPGTIHGGTLRAGRQKKRGRVSPASRNDQWFIDQRCSLYAVKSFFVPVNWSRGMGQLQPRAWSPPIDQL